MTKIWLYLVEMAMTEIWLYLAESALANEFSWIKPDQNFTE